MRVIDFEADSGLLGRFLDWPRVHYAGDPNWLPDAGEARLLTSGPGQGAAWRNFLALEGDEVRGRLAAILNPRLCDGDGRPYAQLGFFECVQDPAAAALLCERALGWLRAAVPNAQTVLGPLNFDTWHAYRLRTRGFDQSTFLMEPYNPSFYPSLFTGLGFTPVSQYLTKTVTDTGRLRAAWEPHHHDALRKGYSFRTLDRASMPAEMGLVHRLSLEIFRDNLFFVDITEEEFNSLYAGVAGRMDPELMVFLLDPAGEAVGFCFSVPDHRDGATVNLKTFGVLPNERGRGLGAALACQAYREFAAKGFTRVNHCLMRRGNRADHFDAGLGEVTREYTLYARPLTP
jgi:GNAT superfamily N-acetyltransferase